MTKKERFTHAMVKEFQIVKMLDHPNIIKVFDLYETESNLYLCSEYCEGGEVFDFIAESCRLSE
jgi:serine/threonine protein kinase